MSVKILIANREYSDYKFVNIDTEELVEKKNIDIFGKKILNYEAILSFHQLYLWIESPPRIRQRSCQNSQQGCFATC